MKKLIIGAAVFVGALAAVRRFGPALEGWAMSKCEQMFDRMPEDFPPKRMLHGIEEIRAQNTQILRQLEQEKQQRTTLAAGV
jgi:hypothetical protein